MMTSSMHRLLHKKVTIQKSMDELRYFWDVDVDFESPVNIILKTVRPINTPKLFWYNVKIKPHKTKITNNGYSVFVTSKWGRGMPYLSNGPFGERKFLFYNIHFHWSDSNNRGSEHRINGESFPFEMHVLWRNDVYKTASRAKKEIDGIVILAYLFEISISGLDNPGLDPIVDYLEIVRKAPASTYMEDPVSVSELMPQLEEDFFYYRGSIKDSQRAHQITWIVCRQLQQIGIKQLTTFRHLLKVNGFGIANNSRPTGEMPLGRTVFHVLPPPALTSRSTRMALFYSFYQGTPFMDYERDDRGIMDLKNFEEAYLAEGRELDFSRLIKNLLTIHRFRTSACYMEANYSTHALDSESELSREISQTDR
ncbi:carbonic anhydrase 1 isoform X2 [Halyomorpha halys]|uniref:carbonic anhydrase 1 isoform X2 n=1 Tax=Halyomorpha halys TaxID=286706 RepID=UPI0006D4D61D|nr:carbonic anhydrase 1 isoform X2 [Halyomorpha halys]